MMNAARRATAPFRNFFNDHFAMVKQEITTTREQVLGAGTDLARNQEVVALSADKVRDSVGFVGMRLGRLSEQYEEVLAAVQRIERGGAARQDAIWSAFAGAALAHLAAGSTVLVIGDARPALVDALRALGLAVDRNDSWVADSHISAAVVTDRTLDAWVDAHVGSAPATEASNALTDVLLVGLRGPGGYDDDSLTVVRSITLDDGGRLVAAQRP